MRIRKMKSVDVKLYDSTKVKLKTAGNTQVVQFTAGVNKSCPVQNLSKDTYLDKKTGEVKQKKKSENRYQSPKSARKSINRLMALVRCNATESAKCKWLTVTYEEVMTDGKQAFLDAKLFLRKLKRHLAKQNNLKSGQKSFQYITIAEPQGEKHGYITEYTYDPVGNLTSVLEPGGAKTSYGYDANSNVTSTTDPLGYTTAYAYDKSSRLTATADALGQMEYYAYNKNGQITAETNKAGFTTTYTYDLHGNVLSVTDAVNYTTNYSYDSLDNLKKVVTAGGSTATYSYDSMGNMLTYTSSLGNTTAYTYDLEGNQTSKTDASGRTETYVYDASGRMTSLITASGDTTTYNYDALNQLIEKAYSNANGETTESSVLYGYDASGRRISMTDGIGTASYTYDALGRVTFATDSAGQSVAYAYDGRGNVTEITYPDGTKVTYTYDLNNNLTSVTDRNGETITYVYDALNRMVAACRPNYLTTYVTYDAKDHITKIENIHMVTGRMMASYEYAYNEAGYVTQEIVKETVMSEAFEELYDLFLDTILGHIDLNNYQFVLDAWKEFYDAQHTFCDHNDADGDGNYDDCKWAFLTATTTYNYRYDANWQLTNCTETLQNGIITEMEGEKFMEQERENIIEATTVEMDESAATPKHPMKWFKFIIYVQLFLNVVLLGFQGVMYITGGNYGADAALVYAYYGNALKAFDILCGVLYLGLSGFALYTRMRLAKFKKNAPTCYLVFWSVQEVVAIVYLICVCIITGQWAVNTISNMVGSVIGAVIAIIVNYIYFKKRQDLFVN